MQRVVELVATLQKLEKDLEESVILGFDSACSGIISAKYNISPSKCKTPLGSWLASVIDSTRFDSCASKCLVILPVTEEGFAIKEFGEQISKRANIKTKEEAQALFAEITSWASGRLGGLIGLDKSELPQRVISFQWPVFGSAAADGAETPEEYFDVCAKQIRRTRGVVFQAGRSNSELPDYLAGSMVEKQRLAVSDNAAKANSKNWQ